MTADTYILVVTCAAAALAAWLYVRLAARAPDDVTRSFVHFAVALGASWLVVPVLRFVLDAGVSPGPALLVTVLPALTYMLLATLWIMRALQGLIFGLRR